MSSLRKSKIEELVVVHNNKRIPLSSKQREGVKKIYPYYGAQGIVDYVDNFLFDGEYILIAEDGENLRSNNKNICNLVNGKFWVNNHAHIITANENNVTKYLYYNFSLIRFEPYVTGSAQPKLNKENLLGVQTYVHTKREQQKIASVLSSLDSKIELNNRINAELEAMAKTIYDYWFVQFDFPDKKGKPYKTSGGKMVWNEELKREIPEGWGAGTLDTVCNIFNGYAFKSEWYKEHGTKIIRTKNFENGYIELNDLVYVDEEKSKEFNKFQLEQFDFLMVMVGASTGKNCIVNSNILPALQNQNMWKFKSKIKGHQLFLNLKLAKVILELENVTNGSARGFFQKDSFLKKMVEIPKKEIVEMFCKKVVSNFNRIDLNLKENQHLTELRDWLLPMLMNGQVKVKEAEEMLSMAAEGEAVYKKKGTN